MLGFLSIIVVLVVLLFTLHFICATLENASDTIISALRGEKRVFAATTVLLRRNRRSIVVTRPAFAPLRAAA